MSTKEELAEEAQERDLELHALVGRLSPEEMDVPGLNKEGWAAKDALWHLGCWSAEAACQIERVRLGTYAEQEWDDVATNARYLEEGRRQDLATVKAELASARNRALQEWGALEEITREAEEWFRDSEVVHYDDHLAELRVWVAEIESRRG